MFVVCVKRGREGRKEEEPSPLFLPREKVGRKREEERYIAPPISAKPLSPPPPPSPPLQHNMCAAASSPFFQTDGSTIKRER